MMACLCSVVSGTSAGKTQRTGGVFENEHCPQCFQLHVCVKINNSGPESCLENPMDRGAWWATGHRVTESDARAHRVVRTVFHQWCAVAPGKSPARVEFHVDFYRALGFLGGSDRKESACSAGDPGLIPGQKDPLENGMAPHCSILAWRSPWTEEPGGLHP